MSALSAAGILLVGGGKMGGALAQGWLAKGLKPQAVTVVETSPETARMIASRLGVTVVDRPDKIDAAARPDVVVFAVKPQMMDGAAPGYRRFVRPETVFLSIAAGKSIAYFETILGPEAAIVRSMPNTPAAVGRGMSVACANRRATPEQVARCRGLLEAVGDVAWIDDEKLLDAVTATSGSGPAYVFLLVECLAVAGVAAGLPRQLAERLARATIVGSGELLARSTESPAVLRQNVTSPAGTTAAALAVLMASDGLQPLLTRAVAAAADRSRELGGEPKR